MSEKATGSRIEKLCGMQPCIQSGCVCHEMVKTSCQKWLNGPGMSQLGLEARGLRWIQGASKDRRFSLERGSLMVEMSLSEMVLRLQLAAQLASTG